MPPVAGFFLAVGSGLASIAATIGGVVSAIGSFTIGGFAVGRVLLNVGITLALNSIFSPKKPKVSVAERQASVLELSLGETPRQAIFGRAATGGSLVNAWNYGDDNEFEVLVIAVADHECDALEGFYVNDKFYEFTGNFELDHEDFEDTPDDIVLSVTWSNGATDAGQNTLVNEYGIPAGEYDASDALNGVAHVVVRYRWSEKVWASGRPSFKWIVRGHLCYDPRADDTAGGSGDQRWGDASTYAWTENAAICRANFIWGVWNYYPSPPQLMVGPGKSLDELTVAEVIAAANICDEDVPLKAGGTEDRYRVGCVVDANTPWIAVDEDFAAAMGGQLVERDGTISLDVGAAKTAEFIFSDNQLKVGSEVRFQEKVTRDELVNTVIARYVDPAQLWSDNAAPMRRSAEDIAEDGGVFELTIDLPFVTSATQAQRIAEITRRRRRITQAAAVTLGPAYMLVEDGDWGAWVSNRYFDGIYRTFEVQGVQVDQYGTTQLALRQVDSSIFSWTAATDEIDPTQPIYLPPGGLVDAELAGFTVAPITIVEAGLQEGAIQVNWTAPTDGAIYAVLIQWRKLDSLTINSATTNDVAGGEYIISSGLIGGATFEVRIQPLTNPRRDEVASDWETVVVPESSGNASLPFTAVQTTNMTVVGRSVRKLDTPLDDEVLFDDDDPVLWDDDDPLLWDGGIDQLISAESYTNGAVALGVAYATDKALMFGLSDNPSPIHWESINFAWSLGADGKRRIYESGVLVWDNEGVPEDYVVADAFSVSYDGAFVRYYVSGVLKYQSAAEPNLVLFFDSAFITDGARLEGVSFNSLSTAGEVYETRYKRSVAPPDTPTGADPIDWGAAVPPGTAALWSVTAKKTQSGALVGEWSPPSLMTSPNWRGDYLYFATYYREDAVVFNGGSYRLKVATSTGNAPSGTNQENAYWSVISSPGGVALPAPGGGYTSTIDIASSSVGVNLYDLAIADGYDGQDDATIIFEVESGVTITGLAGSGGAPGIPGGIAIDTGSWPTSTYSIDLTIRIKSGGKVYGGGGGGGRGSVGQSAGYGGGAGGDAIYCRLPVYVDIQAGGELKGGGAGGGGGGGMYQAWGGAILLGGGGGGGGFPNGGGGPRGRTDDNSTAGADGTAATTPAANGTGGTQSTREAGGGGNGGVAAQEGQAGSPTQNPAGQYGGGATAAGGYAIRFNGHSVTYDANGDVAGSTA